MNPRLQRRLKKSPRRPPRLHERHEGATQHVRCTSALTCAHSQPSERYRRNAANNALRNLPKLPETLVNMYALDSLEPASSVRASDVRLGSNVNDNAIESLPTPLPGNLQRLCASPACVLRWPGNGSMQRLLACSEARNNNLTVWAPFYADSKGVLQLQPKWLRRVYATSSATRYAWARATFVAFAGTCAATSCGSSASMSS